MSYHFNHFDRRVEMTVCRSFVAARYSPSPTTFKLVADLAGRGPFKSKREVVDLPHRGMLLLPMLAGRAEEASILISKCEDIEPGPVVFESDDALLLPDGCVNADLSNRGKAEVAELLARVGATVKRGPEKSSPHHVLAPREGSAFALANRLVESERVMAQPRFDRLRTPPRTSALSPTAGAGELMSGLWGRKAIQADEAWTMTRGRREVVVALLDTGVALKHPELEPNLIGGIDDIDGDTLPEPVAGAGNEHGTECAGILGARPGNPFGVSGVAPLGGILPVRMMTAGPGGQFLEMADAEPRCIRQAADLGARVICASFGDATPRWDLDAAVAYAIARGCVVVAAAGNDNGAVSFPAALPGVLAVAAVSSSGNRCTSKEWGFHPFSGLPLGSCFGREIFIAAPGQQIATTTLLPSRFTASFNGTSAACAFVAGAVVLMLTVNQGLTLSEIREILAGTATKIGSAGYDGTGWNAFLGHGRVDAAAAVKRV